MLNPIDCLIQTIGLSPNDCPCNGVAPEGVDGLSGYYITTGENGIPIHFAGAISDCENGGAWDILTSARTNGAKRFWVDLTREFAKNHKPMYPKFEGPIGRVENAMAVQSDKRRAVLRIESKQLPAYLKVKGAWMFSTVGGTVDLDFYQSDNTGTVIASKELTLAAGKYNYTAFASPVVLNLHGPQYVEGPIYYATWALQDGDYARKNTFFCCNTNKGTHGGFLDVDGWMVDSITDMETDAASSKGLIALGCVLDVEMSCTMSPFVCGLSFDVYEDGSYALQVASAVKEAAVMCLADSILASPNINYLTVYSMETIDRIKVDAEKKYLERIKYLGRITPGGAERCYQCGNGMLNVESIMV